MVNWILKKIFGSKNHRELRRMAPTVRRINEFDEQFKNLSDDDLRAKTAAWKDEFSKIADPEEQWRQLEQILPEAFAVVKNAARRLKDQAGSGGNSPYLLVGNTPESLRKTLDTGRRRPVR